MKRMCNGICRYCQDLNVLNLIIFIQTIEKMPDKILLRIFSYLPHRQVSRLARVCKKWRMISCDTRLWTHVSLRGEISGLHVPNIETLLALISVRFGKFFLINQKEKKLFSNKCINWFLRKVLPCVTSNSPLI